MGDDRLTGSPLIEVDDVGAYMTLREFDDLLDYSRSMPTGTTNGKRWKREQAGGWLMGEYCEVDDPNKVGVKWREIFIHNNHLSEPPA